MDRHDGVNYFRVQLPRSAQESFFKREVRVSLRTRDHCAACHGAEIGRGQIHRLCARLDDVTDLTDVQLQETLRAFCRDRLASTGWPACLIM